MSHTTASELSGAMQDQACQWIVRLRADDVSAADREQFALWLAANPAHRQAMDAMLAMWEDLEILNYRGESRERREESIPARRSEPGENTAAPARYGRRRWLGTGLALAASLVLAVLLAPGLGLGPDTQEYRTRLGEQLAVTLPDGSTVKLNTDSRLLVSYSASERQLTLARGEAFFKVQHDTSRPFLVTAGNTEVRALGTAFNILLTGEHSEITVTEGVVRITELNAPDARPAHSELLYSDQRMRGD